MFEDFPHWPVFAAEEIAAVTACLQSGHVNYWTGNEGRAFEREFAAAIGVPHAVALSNGTVALELALQALGIGPGDEVITTPRTFIASVSCIVAVGARPVFADVDAESGVLTVATIAAALTPRTRAVICVHLGGWPCAMGAIMDLARQHGLAVVEDCAQAHGARYQGRPVGSWGDIAAWSFCQDKIMTTGGEGGMITTSREDLFAAVWQRKDHGKDPHLVAAPATGLGFRWLHTAFGTNARMTEMQAAIGRVQLRSLDEWHARRTANARILTDRWRDQVALRLPWPDPSCTHAWYKVHAYLDPQRLRAHWDRDRILRAIHDQGVPCFAGSCSEVYREAAIPVAWRPPGGLPVAAHLGATSLQFLVHPTLTSTHQERVAEAVVRVLAEATT